MVLKFRKQKFGIFLIVALVFILILSFASAVYTRAYIQNNQFTLNEADIKSDGVAGFGAFDSSMCRDGQDFVLNVLPFGCDPVVVRSDLLEEQDVTVFCKISATQINPLIEVNSIDRIILTGQYPREVSTVGYFPARAALGRFGSLQINQPILENIGYAAITLRRNPNESSMPDFVEGNLTARIRYDIDKAFGIGRSVYYLPEFGSDADFQNSRNAYSFWDGKGYLRAESITNDGAIISVYSGRSLGGFSGGEPVKIANLNLRKGEKSLEIFIPGFNFCLGGLTVTLRGVENPDTRARFNVNGNSFEAKEKEEFLDGKCSVRKMEKRGAIQEVSLNCNVDEGDGSFNLIIAPEVNLMWDNKIENVSLGEKLYGDSEKSVYLAYIGTKKNSEGGENLFVSLVAIPEHKSRLSKDQLDSMAGYIERYDSYDEFTGIGIVDFAANILKFYGGISESILRYFKDGESFENIIINEERDFYGEKVTFSGFADAQNVGFGSLEVEQNYEKAVIDYREIINSFSGEKYPDLDEDELTLGETAFRNLIELANGVNQKQDVLAFCSEFEEIYPEVEYPEIELPIDCTDLLKLANKENSVNDVLINGKIHRISLEGIKEPSFNEFGVEITISGAEDDNFNGDKELISNRRIFVSETEFIILKDLELDYAVFDVSSIKKDLKEKLTYSPKSLRVNLNDYSQGIGDENYVIGVNRINLKKVARVSVDPTIRNAETIADFNFKIGIDKRAIQLSPEKINEKLQSTTERLEKLRGFQSKLEPVVEGFENACKVASLASVFKTFWVNLGGEGIARQKVMRGENGWFDKCREEVEETKKSIDSCLLDHNSEIGEAVEDVKTEQDRINREMKEFREGITETSFLGEDVVNTTALIKRCVNNYRDELSSNLQSGLGSSIKIVGESNPIGVSEILSRVNKDTVSITQCRELQLNSRLLSSDNDVVRDIAERELKASLNDIYINTEEAVERRNFLTEIGSSAATVYSSEELTEITATNLETWGNVNDKYSGGETIDDESFVHFVKDRSNGLRHLLVLDDDHDVTKTYLIGSGNGLIEMSGEGDPNPLKLSLKYFDATTYQNPFISSDYKVRYYESGNYKGLPAIVPFDKENGWYASVKSTLPVAGNIRAFDDSGRVSSFWLCNVGKNGKAEFNSGFGDDICQGINLGTGQPYNVFNGLSSTEASKQINRAVRALEQASRAHKPGIQSVRLTIPGLPAQNIPVGEPAVNIPDIQCQDFMSPFECNFLFNACDPIICPSSRCDFGGAYPVADVVQSGIGGSLLLCLPNFPEVVVPICLSGVQAGLQGWESVLESYQQCLQTSSDTGQTIGICDEINSVYQCDLLWRQVAPISKIVVPKLTGKILGQDIRGGGEYLGARDAFDRAKNSADFYRNYYTDNANAAFRARNLQEAAVGAVCRNSLSAIYPGAEIFDNLISADSPPQFYGRFDEIPFTTVTNPPTSQYKVFYHIFAGKDFGAYYQVYLKGSGSSFFQDTLSRRIVTSDFIPAGGYHTDTADFTAPSGFNEMCIVVNGQEECGFKEVTTEFAFTYVRDQYIQGQLQQTEIKSERECISGTLNVYSLLSPTSVAQITSGIFPASASENFIDPQIYNQGITRICATNSPGKGSDSSFGTESARWQEVGHCGDEGLKCWLDKRSIQTAVESFDIEDELLKDFESRSLGILRSEVDDQYDFGEIVGDVENVEDEPLEVIGIVDEIINKVFFNRERAYLHLLRGNAFGSLARSFLVARPSGPTTIGEEGETEGGEPGIIPGTTVISAISDDVEDAIRSSDNSQLQYPVFKFDNGKFGGDLYYIYSDNKWFWSENKEKWINSQLSSFENSEVQNSNFAQQDVTRVTSDLDIFERQNDENKNFIKSLVGKSYLEGLNLLIRLTERNDGAGLFSVKSKLSTESVGFSPDDIFDVEISAISYPIEYSFVEREWKHTLLFPGEQVPQEIINLIGALDGKLFLEGAEIIFSINSVNRLDLFSGTSTTSQSQLECNSLLDCQKILGSEIKKLADEIQASEEGSRNFDEEVKDASVAESFECLILQIAYVESTVQQCRPVQEGGDPLHCKNDYGKTVEGDDGASWGIMQINTNAHTDAGDVTGFETNVRFGINLLIENYNSGEKNYRCHEQIPGDGEYVNVLYSGWERALRWYNGWNPACEDSEGNKVGGNFNYVEDVEKVKENDNFKNLFPECGISGSSPGQVAENDITDSSSEASPGQVSEIR